MTDNVHFVDNRINLLESHGFAFGNFYHIF
jgi:hypothetical protein